MRFSPGRGRCARDPATFRLIWGTPAFICVALGYGLVAMGAYALAFWAAPYAETVLHLPKQQLAFILGGNGALGGFFGVILGGRMADFLRARHPAGRVLVVLFGMIAPVVPLWIGYTTAHATLFYAMNLVAILCSSAALGAAAATTQDLVLPRMRGTATAAFLLGATFVGLSFGPYLVGQISDLTGTMVDGHLVGNLRAGILALIGIAPVGTAILLYASRALPAAEASVIARARAVGELV